MIDVKLLLLDFNTLSAALAKRHVSSQLLEELALLATSYKQYKQHLESLQEKQNSYSKRFGMLKAQGAQIDALASLRNELEANKIDIARAQEDVRKAQVLLESMLAEVPNPPDALTPYGDSEQDNHEIKRILEPRAFHFTPKDHVDLAALNGWIDFSAGVKLAKSRFSVLRKEGALLARALINFMIDSNRKAGFELVATPVIVNSAMLFGTGQLPKFADDMFQLVWEDEKAGVDVEGEATLEKRGHKLYLISTSEITLTNLYHNSIINAHELPICLTAQTPCFRKEAGSAGRDTRGMIREHQFDKVELVAITHPSQSDAMQETMLATASKILCDLELPHRFMRLCSGDLGFSASNTIDIEVWLPGQGCYREISSISNTRDFQARRAKIRYKEGGKNHFVHTLNGSSLAVGRTLVAIMENYQQDDGSITIPTVLKPYMR